MLSPTNLEGVVFMVVDSFRDLFWWLVGIFDGATHAAHLFKKKGSTFHWGGHA